MTNKKLSRRDAMKILGAAVGSAALGLVAPRPFLAQEAERFLEGRSASLENIRQAAEIERGETDPRGNVLRALRNYRLATIPAIIENALSNAVERALGVVTIPG